MDSEAVFFARPTADRISLDVAPRLDQARLGEFLDHAEERVRAHLQDGDGPLALALDVGLPSGDGFLEHDDLGDYLVPLVNRLRSTTQREFVSVWATKTVADTSYISVGPTESTDGPLSPMEFMVAASAS